MELFRQRIEELKAEITKHNKAYYEQDAPTISDFEYDELFRELKKLEELYPEGMTDTELNNFMWFEDDTIAEWLGYNDFDEIMNRSEEE